MTADGNNQRKRRFTPTPAATGTTLTPLAIRLLLLLYQYGGLLSVPQFAVLANISLQAVRRQLRKAFDLRCVEVISLPRIRVNPEGHAVASLAGSFSNIYQPTIKGLRYLAQFGLIEDVTPPTRYSPYQFSFLLHELGCRDFLLYFLRCARAYPGHELLTWRLGGAAAIHLHSSTTHKIARPDAVLTYRFGTRTLAACLEFDQATERSVQFAQKVKTYQLLLFGGQFAEMTGSTYGRVLIVCPSPQRRDHLAALIAKEADPALRERFYVATREALSTPDLTLPHWRRPGQEGLHPLIPAALLAEQMHTA